MSTYFLRTALTLILSMSAVLCAGDQPCAAGDPVERPAFRSGSWPSSKFPNIDITQGHDLIPIGEKYLLDWVRESGSYRLFRFDPTERSVLVAPKKTKGTWGSIRSGHLLVPVGASGDYVLDWEYKSGKYRTWIFRPSKKDPLSWSYFVPGNTASKQRGQWKTIKAGHELAGVGKDYVLDHVKATREYRLWKFSSGSREPLPGKPKQSGEWTKGEEKYRFQALGEHMVLGTYVTGTWLRRGPKKTYYKIWRFDPDRSNPLSPTNLSGEFDGVWNLAAFGPNYLLKFKRQPTKTDFELFRLSTSPEQGDTKNEEVSKVHEGDLRISGDAIVGILDDLIASNMQIKLDSEHNDSNISFSSSMAIEPLAGTTFPIRLSYVPIDPTPQANQRFGVYSAYSGFRGEGGRRWHKSVSTVALAAGDVDGDGLDEIGVCRLTGGIRVRLYDDGVRDFAPLHDFTHTDGWGDSRLATSVAFGNLDSADAAAEVVYARNGGGGGPRLYVRDDKSNDYRLLNDFKWEGSSNGPSLSHWGDSYGVADVACGQLDADGRDEIAIVGHGKIYIFDDADAKFRQLTRYDTRHPACLALGDVDGDGRKEIVFGRNDRHLPEKSMRLRVLDDQLGNFKPLNEGMRSDGLRQDLGHWGGGSVVDVECGNFDSDRAEEIVVVRGGFDPVSGANLGGGQIILLDDLHNNFNVLASWEPTHWGSSRRITDVACGDVDGDGQSEIVFGRTEGANRRFGALEFRNGEIEYVNKSVFPADGANWGDSRQATAVTTGRFFKERGNACVVGRDGNYPWYTKFPFDVVPIIRLTINDLKTKSISLANTGWAYRVRLKFEGGGDELVWFGLDPNVVPTNIDNIEATLYLRPVKTSGSNSLLRKGGTDCLKFELYGRPEIEFDMPYVFGFFEEDAETALENEIGKAVLAAVQNSAVQRELCKAIREKLIQQVGNVGADLLNRAVTLKVQGTDLVFDFAVPQYDSEDHVLLDGVGGEGAPHLSGVFTIQQKSSKRYVDAYDNGSHDFRLVTRPAQRHDSQRWVIQPAGEGAYTIKQRNTGRVADGTSRMDNSIVSRNHSGTSAQRWVIKAVSKDTYTIQLISTGQYLDAYDNGKNDWRVVTRTSQANDSQRWVITRFSSARGPR